MEKMWINYGARKRQFEAAYVADAADAGEVDRRADHIYVRLSEKIRYANVFLLKGKIGSS